MNFNVTNQTDITDILLSNCGIQTIGSLVLFILLSMSEVMPFLGDSERNNGMLQFICKLLVSLTKMKKSQNGIEMS